MSDSPEQILEPGYKLATRELSILDPDGNIIWEFPTDSPSVLQMPIGTEFGNIIWGKYHQHSAELNGKNNINGTPTQTEFNYLLGVLRYYKLIADSPQ